MGIIRNYFASKIFIIALQMGVTLPTIQKKIYLLIRSCQSLRVETSNLAYFSAYIIRLICKVADFVMEC